MCLSKNRHTSVFYFLLLLCVCDYCILNDEIHNKLGKDGILDVVLAVCFFKLCNIIIAVFAEICHCGQGCPDSGEPHADGSQQLSPHHRQVQHRVKSVLLIAFFTDRVRNGHYEC